MTHQGAERPAEGRTLDQRDMTREPACYLSPLWVLRMRKRLAAAQVEGYRPWPYWEGYAL